MAYILAYYNLHETHETITYSLNVWIFPHGDVGIDICERCEQDWFGLGLSAEWEDKNHFTKLKL